jgi:O-antigen ligase
VSAQIIVSSYQFQIGEVGLLQWSYNYKDQLADKFIGDFFRPFGTSNIAGGASTTLFLGTPIAISILVGLRRWYGQILAGLVLLGSIYVLFISQVRSAQIKLALALGIWVVTLGLHYKAKPLLPLVAFSLVASLLISLFIGFADPKFSAATARIQSLENFSAVWEHRSSGTYESIVEIIKRAPFGTGLSRVGAGSGPFVALIDANPYFGRVWSFADNLYKALLIEIGIPGLIIYLAFLFLITLEASSGLFLRGTPQDVISYQGAAFGGVIAAISGHMGSEGFLYQPECTFVWLALGLLVKTKVLLRETNPRV